VALWDGTSWSALGAGMDARVRALTPMPNGDVVAGGDFVLADGVSAAHIARWTGSTWSPLGTGVFSFLNPTVHSLAVLPNGDLIAGGYFTVAGGTAAINIARWDGGAWSALDNGVDEAVRTLHLRSGTELAVGGDFTTANGEVSAYFARYVTTCPATAAVGSNGCASSGGANTLTATTLPWVDTTFRATATGLPTLALLLALTSVTPIAPGAVPLDTVFAQAGVGCDLLVSPDIMGLSFTTTGTAESQLYLQSSPPLAGVTFYHQWVVVEVDSGLQFLAVTATNSLELVAGDF
jgi:hypothetical protein